MFYLDTESIDFPNPELAAANGVLAIGGDLSTKRLKEAYDLGIFPWYSDNSPIVWYAPHNRFVLFPEKIKITRSMRPVINSGRYSVRVNTCFDRVIENCAKIKRVGQDSTWIIQDMLDAYKKFHKEGYAISIEVFMNNELVGGLYGVDCKRVFCGESMFSLEPNASKLALIYLCQQMNYELIDCQVYTEHLESMGAEMIPSTLFREYLR